MNSDEEYKLVWAEEDANIGHHDDMAVGIVTG